MFRGYMTAVCPRYYIKRQYIPIRYIPILILYTINIVAAGARGMKNLYEEMICC